MQVEKRLDDIKADGMEWRGRGGGEEEEEEGRLRRRWEEEEVGPE